MKIAYRTERGFQRNLAAAYFPVSKRLDYWKESGRLPSRHSSRLVAKA
jgi:hypothetical protein